jgi:hypothetical protein
MVITAIVSAVVGGAAVGGLYYKLHPEELVPKYPMKVMSTGTEPMDPCKPFPFTANKHPTRYIRVTIPAPFDPRNLQPTMWEWPVTQSPWTSPDSGPGAQFDNKVDWTPKTRLDMNLDLADQPTGPKPEMVLVNVVLADQTVSFRNDAFAVAVGDTNGKKMFCSIGGFGPHEATFVAYYYHNPNPGKKGTFGSFNIGLIVPDGTDPAYTLPLFLDPDVENNGFQ